jgi:hypothetical protein
MTDVGQLLRLIVTILLGAQALLGCSYERIGVPQTEPASGVEGLVMIGPTCPIEREAGTCPDEPLVATLIVQEQESGRTVLTLQSAADGQFRANLVPGDYLLVPVSPNPGVPPEAEPVEVTVEPGRYTNVTVTYDSGIR